MKDREPFKMNIEELEECPTNRPDLFNFYRGYGAETKHFELVLKHIASGNKVYFSKKWYGFYNQEGELIAREELDWGD